MHEGPLRRIAEETGGRFYTPETAAGMAEDVRYAGRGVTSVEERELWNMPIILIALMGLVCAEWGYRRGGRVCPDAQGLSPHRRRPRRRPEHGELFHKWGTALVEASAKVGVDARAGHLPRRREGQAARG